uniref:Uncharacterized protein n=1 Tax=Panagrolaimus superbus TaxID=310955 RepID=A0A914YKB5_9BILA
MDPVSVLEFEFLYQTSYQYPPQMIKRLPANLLISEAKNAAKSAHQFANSNPIKALQEAILAQWMLKHVVKNCIDARMEAVFKETQTNVSWIITRQKDILKFFVQ